MRFPIETVEWNGRSLRTRAEHLVVKVDEAVPIQQAPSALLQQLAGAANIERQFGRFFLLKATGGSSALLSLAQGLMGSSAIQLAHPDTLIKPASPPSGDYDALSKDSQFDTQWGLHRIGTLDAWKDQTGDQSVLIGIADSGIRMEHPDFDPARFTLGTDWAPGSPDLPTAGDEMGHGTHIAGIVAAHAGGGLIAGLNWGSDVHVCNVFDPDEEVTDAWAVLAAVKEIATRAAADGRHAVINLSLGVDGEVDVLQEMCSQTSGGSVLLCCASGNASQNEAWLPAGYAAEFDHVLAVGATTMDQGAFQAGGFGDEWIWGGSNCSPALSVTAPGDNIVSLAGADWYAEQSGTSQATAMVCGAASLAWCQAPLANAAEIAAVLRDTAWRPVGVAPNSCWGAGRIELAAIVKRAGELQVELESSGRTGTGGSPAPPSDPSAWWKDEA
jgi:hypothetical protein